MRDTTEYIAIGAVGVGERLANRIHLTDQYSQLASAT